MQVYLANWSLTRHESPGSSQVFLITWHCDHCLFNYRQLSVLRRQVASAFHARPDDKHQVLLTLRKVYLLKLGALRHLVISNFINVTFNVTVNAACSLSLV